MGKNRLRLAIAFSTVSLILAIVAGWATWHCAREWLYSPMVDIEAPVPAQPVPAAAAAPAGPHVIGPDDFVGTWTGYWDGIYSTRLQIRRANGRSLSVTYDWEEVLGAPMLRKMLHPTPVGTLLHMPRAQMTMTLSDTEPDTATAVVLDNVNGIEHRRTATLGRGREPAETNWLGGDRSAAATTQPIGLDIKATIDRSDVLQFSRSGAVWTHNAFQWATDVSINGVGWDAKAQPILRDTGLADADFGSARVISRSGRDVAAMENTSDGMAVYFDDAPPGSGPYEVKIAMARRGDEMPAASRPEATSIILDVSADIDGSDVLTISSAGARWTHQSQNWPTDVSINGRAWDVQAKPAIDDVGLSGADLSSASVVERSGRDVVLMEKTADGIAIYFDDAPAGADKYHIKIRFGAR